MAFRYPFEIMVAHAVELPLGPLLPMFQQYLRTTVEVQLEEVVQLEEGFGIRADRPSNVVDICNRPTSRIEKTKAADDGPLRWVSAACRFHPFGSDPLHSVPMCSDAMRPVADAAWQP